MYASSSNLSTSRRSAPSSSSALPSWLFDVEEFDEEDTGETLLDGSSAGGILRMLVWVMKLPVLLLMCRSSVQAAELMPLPTSTLASDLYGPVAVVGLFVLILWAGRVRDTTWVLIIWSGGAAFTHLIARVVRSMCTPCAVLVTSADDTATLIHSHTDTPTNLIRPPSPVHADSTQVHPHGPPRHLGLRRRTSGACGPRHRCGRPYQLGQDYTAG